MNEFQVESRSVNATVENVGMKFYLEEFEMYQSFPREIFEMLTNPFILPPLAFKQDMIAAMLKHEGESCFDKIKRCVRPKYRSRIRHEASVFLVDVHKSDKFLDGVVGRMAVVGPLTLHWIGNDTLGKRGCKRFIFEWMVTLRWVCDEVAKQLINHDELSVMVPTERMCAEIMSYDEQAKKG